MIHYHGTPITPKEQFLRMAGRHFCVSFAQDQDLKKALELGSSVMFDNGAWSAFTRGAPFDERGFYRWLDPILHHPHWAVMPDVIDGGEEENDDLLLGWPNLTFGFEMAAPVWHLHESLDRLARLSDSYSRVCLGSSGEYREIGTAAWSRRMDEAFNRLAQRDRSRTPWVHGMRMLGQAAGDWPLASADSTNVAQNWKRDVGCAECKARGIDIEQTPGIWRPRPIQQEMEIKQ